MRRLALALLPLCVACSDAAFVCEEDVECTGAGVGVCQPDGHCSFPDGECPSGQRYAEHSGALSGECVDPGGGTTAGESTTTRGDTTVASLTDVQPESSGPVTTDDTADTTSPVSVGTTTMPATETSADATDGSTTGEPVDPDLLLWLQFAGDGEFVNDGVVGEVATCEAGCPLQADGVGIFDGTDDCLVAPSDDAFASAAFTAAAWLWRNDEVDEYYYFVIGQSFGAAGDNSWELFVIPDDNLVPVLRAHIAAPIDVVAEISMPPSLEWIHVATTWDGATLQLWLDGEPVAATAAADVSYDDHVVQIGCDDNGVTQDGHLGGRLDDVRFYARALDDAEIAALAESEPPPP